MATIITKSHQDEGAANLVRELEITTQDFLKSRTAAFLVVTVREENDKVVSCIEIKGDRSLIRDSVYEMVKAMPAKRKVVEKLIADLAHALIKNDRDDRKQQKEN